MMSPNWSNAMCDRPSSHAVPIRPCTWYPIPWVAFLSAIICSRPAGSRVVMLAPPNHGSEVADHVRHWPVYRWWTGRVGQQMGTGKDAIVHRLKPIDAEIGVIAANRSIQPWFSALIPGEDDGAVSVAATRLPEMRDFTIVRSSHSLVMFNRRVRRQVLHFLAEGRFAR